MIMANHVNIGTISLIFFIIDDCVFFSRYLILFHVRFDIISCSICWCIIYIHHMIILVFLLENRIKISQIQSVFSIVIWWYVYTHSNLIMNVLADFIFFFIIFFLFLKYFVKCLVFLFRWRVKVEMIQNKLTFEINIMNNLHKPNSSIVLYFCHLNPTINKEIL